MMKYKFFFVDSDTANDPTKLGWSYAKLHESDWVDGPSDFNGNITTGVSKGIDNAIYHDKAYQIYKLYFDVDNNQVIVICVQSTFGCDTKVFK